MLMIVQNDPAVPPGLLLKAVHDSGVTFQICKPFEGGELFLPEGTGGVMVLGGRMSVHDTRDFPFLSKVRDLIARCLETNVPYLGICLGGQLLAQVLGADVHRRTKGEFGICTVTLTGSGENDPVFMGVPRQFITYEWHNDSFDLPKESIHLAHSAACPHQAFRWGEAAYGIQFHPEVDIHIVTEWSKELRDQQEELISEFQKVAGLYRAASLAFLKNFMARAGHARGQGP